MSKEEREQTEAFLRTLFNEKELDEVNPLIELLTKENQE